MLRIAIAAGTPLGLSAKAIVDSGQLVSDTIIFELVCERLKQEDCRNGFLLDGFPRTIPQAQALSNENIDIDFVIEIDVEDEEIVKRISGRRIHPNSKRVYHVLYHPPKEQDKDDETGEPLECRFDDREDIVRKRLEVYHHQTEPLIDFYQQKSKQKIGHSTAFYRVNGEGNVDDIFQRILSVIKE